MSLYPPPQQPVQQLMSAVLRQIQANHYSDEASPHWDAEREYSAEQVALAARDLVRAVDALPEDQRPIGWDTEVPQEDVDTTVPQTLSAEVTVNCREVQMDDGENLKALDVGNYLELDRPTAGMCPGVWLLTAYHGEFSERATLRLLDRDEIAALRRAETSAGIYS
jgi:hypothetical protein